MGSTTLSSSEIVGSSWKNWKTTPTDRPRHCAVAPSLRSCTAVPSIQTLAARRAIDARDHVDERALAATGLPDHGDELPGADLEAHALERGQAPRGRLVLLDDVVEIGSADARPRDRG